MDWKLKLLQVLKCLGDSESTWHDGDWSRYGISDTERNEIEAEYAAWERAQREG